MMTNNSQEYIYEEDLSGAEPIKWVSIGFGIGLLVGGIVGLLMAPKSGPETREQLKEYAGELSVKTKDLAGNLQTKGKDMAKEVTSKVTSTTMDLKDKAAGAATAAQDALKAGKEVVSRVASAMHSAGEDVDNA